MENLQQPVANPFALMLDPESIFRQLESSGRLAMLKSRVCRPLDKPLIPKVGQGEAEFDRAIDAEAEPEAEPLAGPEASDGTPAV